MDFETKLAQTRDYTTTNQLGVDSQEVYNEGILQALDGISPTGNRVNGVFGDIYSSSDSIGAGYVSISFITSADFDGTIFSVAILPNTTINVTAETGATLDEISFTITTGTITAIILNRP